MTFEVSGFKLTASRLIRFKIVDRARKIQVWLYYKAVIDSAHALQQELADRKQDTAGFEGFWKFRLLAFKAQGYRVLGLGRRLDVPRSQRWRID